MAAITVSGGTKWKKVLESMAQKVKVRAGVLEGATNTEGQSVATYGAYNEFGTSRIPPRPFMRNTLEREKKNWINGVGALLQKGLTPEKALMAVGARMANDIKKTIDESIGIEDNAPSTRLKKTKKVTGGKKGETHVPQPLIDKGFLRKAITSELEK